MDYSQLYSAHGKLSEARNKANEIRIDPREAASFLPGIKSFVTSSSSGGGGDHRDKMRVDEGGGVEEMDGFKRMDRCRLALDALDKKGWKRSFFQKKFHNAFMAACARAFFKLDKPGSFQKAFQKILEINSWNNLNQEILISTPRRFGKTISVSMFAAALLFSCSGIELSIYSTCKRISQKLLRNVVKFLDLIYDGLGCERMKVIRSNCEEIHIQGPEGPSDVRVTNSYPSKMTKGGIGVSALIRFFRRHG